MWDPLAEVKYLANSPHRVAVLGTLARSPATRSEIREATGVSQATLSRLLAGFHARGWIEVRDRTYRLTPYGRELSAGITELVGCVDRNRWLHRIAEWLPIEEMGLDLERFGDASVTVPTPVDPTAPMRRATELIESADDVRTLSSGLAPPVIQANWECVVHGTQRVESVRTSEMVRMIGENPRYRTWIRETRESGRATLYCYDTTPPYNLAVLEGSRVFFGAVDADGNILALVETDDESVLAWATATIDAFREESVPLSVEDFPG